MERRLRRWGWDDQGGLESPSLEMGKGHPSVALVCDKVRLRHRLGSVLETFPT